MYDSFNRNINYLRISVTERCNLRCTYCVPDNLVLLRQRKPHLTFEKILEIVQAGALLGLSKIRLTGGEPLLRNQIEDLVGMIAKVPGIHHIAMTTNGTLLAHKARSLKASGLSSINISLDTLNANRYKAITRGGDILSVLEGVDRAAELGFLVKINMVILPDTTAQEIMEMRAFCTKKEIKLQTIEHYSLNQSKITSKAYDRPGSCQSCNRVRLLSNGNLIPCLFSNHEIPINDINVKESLEQAIRNKPYQGTTSSTNSVMLIGG